MKKKSEEQAHERKVINDENLGLKQIQEMLRLESQYSNTKNETSRKWLYKVDKNKWELNEEQNIPAEQPIAAIDDKVSEPRPQMIQIKEEI